MRGKNEKKNILIIIQQLEGGFLMTDLFEKILIILIIVFFVSWIIHICTNMKIMQYKISEGEKKIVAYHGAGHALVSQFLKTQNDIEVVTIVEDDKYEVYTIHKSFENKDCITKTECKERLTLLLAGREAEKIALGENSSLCIRDLEKATNIAREMITIYGMDNEIIPISFGDIYEREMQMHDKITNKIQKLLMEAESEARKIIENNKELLEKIAQELFEKGTISGKELKGITQNVK